MAERELSAVSILTAMTNAWGESYFPDAPIDGAGLALERKVA